MLAHWCKKYYISITMLNLHISFSAFPSFCALAFLAGAVLLRTLHVSRRVALLRTLQPSALLRARALR